MNIPLSDLEISKYVPNVVIYEELPDEIIRFPTIILYQNNKNTGHWVLLDKHKDTIHFFDSYGLKPDAEFKFLAYQQPHYLSRILYDLSKQYTIDYNPYRFQSLDPEVATCGYWCILRHKFQKEGIDDFKRAVDETCSQTGLTPDQLVVELITR